MIITKQDIQYTRDAKLTSRAKKCAKLVYLQKVTSDLGAKWVKQVEELERRQSQNLHKYAKRKNRKPMK